MNKKELKPIANVVGAFIGRPHFEEYTQKRNPSKACSNSNAKHQTLTSNVAITLIALIITIIVMLILVGVTVSIAINGGLFSTAKKAKSETENAIKIEQKLADGKIQVDGEWYNSMDDYFSGKTIKDTGPLGEAIKDEDYGKQVTNFKSKGFPNLIWRVFYEDDNNVYLISETVDKNYPVNPFSFYDWDGTIATKKSIVEKYNSGADVSTQGQDLMPLAKQANLFTSNNKQKNIIATAYMCDIEVWKDYTDEEGKAVWAMGAPTIELFVKSYNATHKKDAKLTVNSIGYDNASLGEGSFVEKINKEIYRLNTSGWWFLASPSNRSESEFCGIHDVTGSISYSYIWSVHPTRPVVCIPQSNFEGFTLE